MLQRGVKISKCEVKPERPCRWEVIVTWVETWKECDFSARVLACTEDENQQDAPPPYINDTSEFLHQSWNSLERYLMWIFNYEVSYIPDTRDSKWQYIGHKNRESQSSSSNPEEKGKLHHLSFPLQQNPSLSTFAYFFTCQLPPDFIFLYIRALS